MIARIGLSNATSLVGGQIWGLSAAESVVAVRCQLIRGILAAGRRSGDEGRHDCRRFAQSRRADVSEGLVERRTG
jgi:hypothetical protein